MTDELSFLVNIDLYLQCTVTLTSHLSRGECAPSWTKRAFLQSLSWPEKLLYPFQLIAVVK